MSGFPQEVLEIGLTPTADFRYLRRQLRSLGDSAVILDIKPLMPNKDDGMLWFEILVEYRA